MNAKQSILIEKNRQKPNQLLIQPQQNQLLGNTSIFQSLQQGIVKKNCKLQQHKSSEQKIQSYFLLFFVISIALFIYWERNVIFKQILSDSELLKKQQIAISLSKIDFSNEIIVTKETVPSGYTEIVEKIPENIRLKLNLEIQNNQYAQKMNLWDMSQKEKQTLLKTYSEFNKKMKQKSGIPSSIYSSIVSNNNSQTDLLLERFQQTSEELKWSALEISKEQSKNYEQQMRGKLAQRQSLTEQYLKKYRSYQGVNESINNFGDITKAQYYKGIEYHRIMMNFLAQNKKIKDLIDREKEQLNQKYGNNKFFKQLKACIIVPTYNNTLKDKYIWNIESILQQQYQNYQVIIVDDASPDNTSYAIGKHLKWRKADPQKFKIIRNLQNKKSLYNFYYAAHKYCNLGEILYTIDGDDQLIGTQVFKTINKIYQKQKPYTLYTQRIVQILKNDFTYLKPGNNHDYTKFVKEHNAYRWDRAHGYHHLRTMISDVFLFADYLTLFDKNENFYSIMTDNAVYFSALQLSCQKVKYLPQFTYWYDYTSPINLYNHFDKQKYQQIAQHIQSQKPYQCIHKYLLESSN